VVVVDSLPGGDGDDGALCLARSRFPLGMFFS